MLRADPLRRVDALGGERGRHPDVGEDGVGPVLGHRAVERLGVGHGLQQVDAVGLGEEPGDPLADQVVVVGEDDADRHGLTVGVAPRPGSAESRRRTPSN